MTPSLLRCCVFIFFTVLFLQFSNQAPLIPGLKYLTRFGYLDSQFLNPKSSVFLSEETLMTAVERFQAFAGIQVTGVLDEDTLAMMKRPRCGIADFPRNEYIWYIKSLTYKISNYSSSLPRNKVDKEIQKAFEIWSRVIPLTFTKITSESFNIEMAFNSGEHGDQEPFDGPGGIFGHSYNSFLTHITKVHFDNSEKWTDNNSYRGINLFQAAAHEIGHALGLSHSDNKAALMHPFYKGCESTFELTEDDVEAVQAKYGENMSPSKTVPSTPSTCKEEPLIKDETNDQGDDELCSENGIDTIFNTTDGLYVFKGSQYWKLNDYTVDAGFPKLISKGWPGLPGNIDAAFTYKKTGKTYFFKGSQYWRYNGSKMDGRYPKNISKGFPGLPDNIDAAMFWGTKGDIYFFKGSQFWSYDPSQKPHISTNYPKPISNWKGIPNDLNAAIQYNNGYTYFFKKDEYYRFNDQSLLVDVENPPFPRPVGYWWLGCIESEK